MKLRAGSRELKAFGTPPPRATGPARNLENRSLPLPAWPQLKIMLRVGPQGSSKSPCQSPNHEFKFQISRPALRPCRARRMSSLGHEKLHMIDFGQGVMLCSAAILGHLLSEGQDQAQGATHLALARDMSLRGMCSDATTTNIHQTSHVQCYFFGQAC